MQLDRFNETIHTKLIAIMGLMITFLTPIAGILIIILFLIIIDTATGIWKAKKLGQMLISVTLSGIIAKIFTYYLTIIMIFGLDHFLINDILQIWLPQHMLFTKFICLIIASVEIFSIEENYRQVKGVGFWTLFQKLTRTIKKGIDELKDSGLKR